MKTACTRAKVNRQIQIGLEWERLKKQAHDNLLSPQGLIMRSQRPVEVEAVFGRLKQDWGFRRFLLRGLEKVKMEWGILSIAHNIAKAAITGSLLFFDPLIFFGIAYFYPLEADFF